MLILNRNVSIEDIEYIVCCYNNQDIMGMPLWDKFYETILDLLLSGF